MHNDELLVMVDLFSRETMLEFLPNRKMERVCQAILKHIIFSRGVPDELRWDNAPARAYAKESYDKYANILTSTKLLQVDIIHGATPFAKESIRLLVQ